jgi:ABC-type sugar transport system ATPase subunit
VTIRPEHLRLHRTTATLPNAFAARIASISFFGEQSECQVEVNGVTLRARVSSDTEFAGGDDVWLELPAPSCRLIL